jgi:hypothetical protein
MDRCSGVTDESANATPMSVVASVKALTANRENMLAPLQASRVAIQLSRAALN